MNSSKNIIIIILACFCLFLLIKDHNRATEFSKLKNNLDKFEISFANWDTGETLFWMLGIPGYDIGFALSNDGHVFWHHIGRVHTIDLGFGNIVDLTEPGVCSDTPAPKYAARPAGCFHQGERVDMRTNAFHYGAAKPACILYDLVNVDRHRL